MTPEQRAQLKQQIDKEVRRRVAVSRAKLDSGVPILFQCKGWSYSQRRSCRRWALDNGYCGTHQDQAPGALP